MAIKKSLLILFLLFLNSSSYAQDNDYNFIGFINIDNHTFLPYQVVLNDSLGAIQGYSIADSFGPDETKSYISGSIIQGVINFKERDVIYTKSDVIVDDFCFLEVEAKIIKKKNQNKLSGNFKAYYSDSSLCISGTLELVDSLSLFKKNERLIRRVQKKVEKKIKELNDKELLILDGESSMELISRSDDIIISIWDNGRVDNDKVSVFHNGNCLLKNYAITKGVKTLSIQLVKGENLIEVQAMNKGLYPPNSARIKLEDDKKVYQVNTVLNVGQSARIIIYKE